MLFCSADRRRSSFLGNYNRKQSFLTPLGVLVLPASLCLGLQKDKLQSGQAAAASRSLTSPVTSRPSPPSPPEQPEAACGWTTFSGLLGRVGAGREPSRPGLPGRALDVLRPDRALQSWRMTALATFLGASERGEADLLDFMEACLKNLHELPGLQVDRVKVMASVCP